MRDLWAPDEPRYAMVAKWIHEHDEFLVLRRCGELHPDKPPLVHWLTSFFGRMSGWSTFAMWAVSIAATLGTARLTRLFARRWFGELEARWAPVLFLGFALILWNGGRTALDLPGLIEVDGLGEDRTGIAEALPSDSAARDWDACDLRARKVSRSTSLIVPNLTSRE